MEALMQVLESTMAARDPYTVGHQRRVSQIACTIGREMGLSEDRLTWSSDSRHAPRPGQVRSPFRTFFPSRGNSPPGVCPD